jgi:2-amino-4-hydroxy-6-hydroxymethyldihydropteridine diphosphokinase
MTRAYVGLGSNLGDREHMIWGAVHMLAFNPDVEVVAVSELRETDPVGYLDQPPFLNAAAALDTELSPHALLELLLTVERELGRTRDGPRFGPRTIDLDVLLYGDEIVEGPGLTIPHPRLHERVFALEPLAELAPGLVVPGRGTVAALLAGLQSS